MNGKEIGAPQLNAEEERARHRGLYESSKRNPFNFCTTSNETPVFASTAPFKSLTRVGIKELELHFPARGSYLLLRTLELPIRFVEIRLLVEDHLGQVITTQLYNFVDYDSEETPEEILPVGTVFILKEPFLKLAVSGEMLIRSDCPTDFIHVDCNHPLYDSVSKIKWKNTIYPENIEKTVPKTALEWKEEGNVLYRRKKYFGSLRSYFAGMKMSSDELLVSFRLNICAAYLALEYYEDSLKYADLVLQAEKANTKALYRSGKAYYGLRQFEEALKMFQRVLKVNPTQKDALSDEQRCMKRLKEKEGQFDVYRLYLTSVLKPSSPIDFGEYIGPIQIAQIEGKGRGIIASQNIKPGTFLLATKALHAVLDKDLMKRTAALRLNSENTFGDAVKLLSGTCQAVMKNPNTFGKAVYGLTTNNPGLDLSVKLFCDQNQEPIVDAHRIKEIVTHNGFSLMNDREKKYATTDDPAGAALFASASYFNHSCINNAFYRTYNDVIVFRSTRHIRKGEEITITYLVVAEDFLKKEEEFEERGFICSCTLCRLDLAESREVHEKRASLELLFKSLCEQHPVRPSSAVEMKMKKVLLKLEKTYTQRSTLKVRLFEPYFLLAQSTVLSYSGADGYTKRLVELVDKALGALGLSCEMFSSCPNDENFSFPRDALLCQTSIYKALLLLINGFQIINDIASAQKWARTLFKFFQTLEGGNLETFKSSLKDFPELTVLLKAL